MLLFHIITVVVVRFAVLAPQNSRRLSGNWREVPIYIHFYQKADGFDATISRVCLLFVLIIKEFVCFVLFEGVLPWCVMACVYNAALQQFPLPPDCRN